MSDMSLQLTLEHSNIFKDLPTGVLQNLVGEFTKFIYRKGQIINYTDIDKYFFIIASGYIKMSRMDVQTGKKIALFLYEKCDVLDVVSLVDGGIHDVEFTSVTSSILYAVKIDRMRELLADERMLNSNFLSYLGSHQRKLECFSEAVAFYNTKTRLINLILRYADPSKVVHGQKIPVKLLSNLTHADIAELIASVRSVVTTEINKLKNEGILSVEHRNITINDLQRLRKKCKNIQ